MYDNFQSQNQEFKCSYTTYFKTFQKENIGFGEPKDICDICAVYKNPQPDEITSEVSSSLT